MGSTQLMLIYSLCVLPLLGREWKNQVLSHYSAKDEHVYMCYPWYSMLTIMFRNMGTIFSILGLRSKYGQCLCHVESTWSQNFNCIKTEYSLNTNCTTNIEPVKCRSSNIVIQSKAMIWSTVQTLPTAVQNYYHNQNISHPFQPSWERRLMFQMPPLMVYEWYLQVDLEKCINFNLWRTGYFLAAFNVYSNLLSMHIQSWQSFWGLLGMSWNLCGVIGFYPTVPQM